MNEGIPQTPRFVASLQPGARLRVACVLLQRTAALLAEQVLDLPELYRLKTASRFEPFP